VRVVSARLLRIVWIALLLGSAAAHASPRFERSAWRAPLPDDPCDTVLTPSMVYAGILQAYLADPARRVFCVQPGDYRGAGRIDLWLSGTASQPRILRYNAQDGLENAVQRPQRAIFESLYILGDHWVVHGLTFRPKLATSVWFVAIYGGDHNLIDGNVIDGAEQHAANGNIGVNVQGYQGDPASHNTIQANVIRNGNVDRVAFADYIGVSIREGYTATEANDFNRVLDNEIYDWGDGVHVSGHREDCTEPAIQHATLVDGNDIYLTAAKRVDCATGAADAEGQCSCAENGIDVKAAPGPDPALWTRLTNNRLWGFRPTAATASCGGSGANGQAITAGSICAGHTLVAHNVVSDSTTGVTIGGDDWIVAGNLFHEIRASDGRGIYMTNAIQPASFSSNVSIQFNTTVGTDAAYDDQSSYTDTRCNAMIEDLALPGTAGFRGSYHSTEHNFLYDAPQPNISGATNASYAAPESSGNTSYCYWRKRFTAPERVCIPYGAATPASTHVLAERDCDAALLAPFGTPEVSYVPEPGAVSGAAVACAAACLLASRRSRTA